MTGGSIPVTRILASFVEGARYEDVGDGALGRVREHVMDCLGVGIAASAEPPGQIIGELIDSLSQGGSTHLIGTRLSSNTLEAAWANGALFHLLDFDDSGFSHPTACILPAALAIGELCDSDGHELVTAMAAGWEVFERISRSGRASEQLLRQKGVHFTSVYGCPAAAATAGKLLGLNAAQLAVAIGLAASASGGLTEQFGTWGKGPHAGNAARAGVTAALLAQRGYRGSDAVLEGEFGLMASLLGRGVVDWSRIEEDLGAAWAIENPGLTIKAYPACAGVQRAVAAALEIRDEVVRDPHAIQAIYVSATESLLDTLHIDIPEEGFGGKFSLRYCLAVALADGEVTVGSFSDGTLERPIVQELMAKTTIRVIPGGREGGIARTLTPVEVHMDDGAVAKKQIDTPLGNVLNRMSLDQVTQKYRKSAGRVLSSEQVDRSVELLHALETTTVRQLVDCLTLG